MDGDPRFTVLGPLRVRFGTRVDVIGGRRERALLAGLLLTPSQPVEVERLVDCLWPTTRPRDTGHALRTHVMRLRQHVGRDLVETSPGAYALAVPPEAVDAHRFDREVAAGKLELQSRRLAGAEEALRAALREWPGGAPWIDLAGTEVGEPERARLNEERMQAEEWLAAVRLSMHRPALDDIEKLAVEAPLRESRWLLLMHALTSEGQQARALRCYSRFRKRLRDEAGLDPDRRLQDMEHRILDQDPSLVDLDPLTLVGS
jgi:DNA-binding SARP family transcriptional activator